LAATLLLAGCVEDKPREPGPTSKPSPAATVPPMPAAALEGSDAGAIAFVRHYIDVFNYASNTGDVKKLNKLSDPDCEECNEYIDLYKETYIDGGYFQDSDWTMSQPTAELQGQTVVVFAHISAPTGSYRLTKNAAIQPGDREDFDGTFVPRFINGRWLLKEIGKQE